MVHLYSQSKPSFSWPSKSTDHHVGAVEQPHTNITSNGIVTTVKNIVNTLLNNQTESLDLPNATEDISTEMFSSNKTDVFQETTNSSVLQEFFGSNNTVANLSTTTSTAISSNNAFVTAMTTSQDSMNVVTEAINRFTDTVTTTAENVFTTVSDTVTASTLPTIGNETNILAGHYNDIGEDKTLYIVLGVILGVLLLIMIMLLIIYKRYKTQHRSRSHVYCVTE